MVLRFSALKTPRLFDVEPSFGILSQPCKAKLPQISIDGVLDWIGLDWIG